MDRPAQQPSRDVARRSFEFDRHPRCGGFVSRKVDRPKGRGVPRAGFELEWPAAHAMPDRDQPFPHGQDVAHGPISPHPIISIRLHAKVLFWRSRDVSRIKHAERHRRPEDVDPNTTIAKPKGHCQRAPVEIIVSHPLSAAKYGCSRADGRIQSWHTSLKSIQSETAAHPRSFVFPKGA